MCESAFRRSAGRVVATATASNQNPFTDGENNVDSIPETGTLLERRALWRRLLQALSSVAKTQSV